VEGNRRGELRDRELRAKENSETVRKEQTQLWKRVENLHLFGFRCGIA
jgi:hypothetical protein